MLRASILGLGVGTLCAALSAIDGAGPIELPAPRPGPGLMALGGDLVDPDFGAGLGCFGPMLDELRRHPRWSIRIDDLEWDDVVDDEPDPRRASIVLDAETGTWRDGWLPQSLTIAEDERRALLAAFALDCSVDASRPHPGFVGRYIGVALGEDGLVVAKFRTNSFVALRLEELFDGIRARYVAGRADDLRGFSLELAGTMRNGTDDLGRPIREPHRAAITGRDLASYDTLEKRVRLLDWALTQPAVLTGGKHVVRGTLRAHGTTRPIAVDLDAYLEVEMRHSMFSELAIWAAIDRDRPDELE